MATYSSSINNEPINMKVFHFHNEFCYPVFFVKSENKTVKLSDYLQNSTLEPYEQRNVCLDANREAEKGEKFLEKTIIVNLSENCNLLEKNLSTSAIEIYKKVKNFVQGKIIVTKNSNTKIEVQVCYPCLCIVPKPQEEKVNKIKEIFNQLGIDAQSWSGFFQTASKCLRKNVVEILKANNFYQNEADWSRALLLIKCLNLDIRIKIPECCYTFAEAAARENDQELLSYYYKTLNDDEPGEDLNYLVNTNHVDQPIKDIICQREINFTRAKRKKLKNKTQ